MIYATLKNHNGNCNCYDVIFVKSESKELIEELRKKEHAYHKHMPGSGYCSIDFETSDYNEIALLRNLVTEKLQSFCKPKFVYLRTEKWNHPIKTDFQRTEMRKIKKQKIDFSRSQYEQELFKGINTRISEQHVYYDNDPFTEEQDQLLKMFKSLNMKIQRFEKYELKES